jgi:hypothetical protein
MQLDDSNDHSPAWLKKKRGVAVSGTRPCVLREYVYVNG